MASIALKAFYSARCALNPQIGVPIRSEIGRATVQLFIPRLKYSGPRMYYQVSAQKTD